MCFVVFLPDSIHVTPGSADTISQTLGGWLGRPWLPATLEVTLPVQQLNKPTEPGLLVRCDFCIKAISRKISVPSRSAAIPALAGLSSPTYSIVSSQKDDSETEAGWLPPELGSSRREAVLWRRRCPVLRFYCVPRDQLPPWALVVFKLTTACPARCCTAILILLLFGGIIIVSVEVFSSGDDSEDNPDGQASGKK
eukprot:627690-Amorphochlora_amoeboformis.AAC.1